ncbi:MAG: Aldehyde ferredoxin oxidoreductase, partial [Deltaproteobacteria bacterium]|nr:Aldehyde ferredoxin oxidoreductase [Deltaproteobacteria bacterium]
MKFGVTGKVLRVDLTERKHQVERPDDTFYRTYFGGSALACHYLLKERGRIENPLGPENLLVFSSSPLVGSGIPGANRYSVAAISPL